MGQYIFRSAGTMVSGTGALVPGMPAGWQPGELLLCFSTCVSASETLAAVSGWTAIAVADNGGHENLRLLARIAQAGDTAPTLSWSGTSNGCAQIAAFRGDVFATLASIVAHVASRESVTTRPKIWGLTVTTAGCLIITMSRIVKTAVSNGTTYNPPTSGITELGEYEANGTNIAAVWGYQIQSAAADIAEASWSPQGTAESSNVNFLALTVALKSSSATANAQGAAGTASATAATASAQGSSGVTAQGSGAVAAAVVAMATVSTDTQQIVVASGSPPSSAMSLKTLFSPPAVDGDVYVVDKVTSPGSYAVTVNADGTFRFDSTGDESRQLIGVDLIQASNGRRRGQGYVAVNNLAPQLIGSAGGFIESAPITPFVPVDRRLHEQIRDPQTNGTLTFDLLAGPLPPGLRLTRGGRLHGVPTNIGTYPITIGVRDEFGALTIVNDIIDVAYGATGAGDTVEATAATATATVSVSASGAGGTVTVNAAAGSASGGSGAAFDYYIGPSGSDSNDGLTTSTPWAITALNTKTGTYAGNSVGIMDGTYNVYSQLVALDDNYDGAVFMIPSGSSGSPTVIQSVNPRGAVFSGKSGANYGNAVGAPTIFGVGAGGHVQFVGLMIGGTNRWGIRVGIPYDPGRARVPGIVVKDCKFYDFDARNLAYKFPEQGVNISCLELNQCGGWLVQNNQFGDCIGWELNNADHQSAIESWQSINGVCEFNTSVNAGSFDGKLGGANGNKFRFNHMDCRHLMTGFNGCFRAWGSDSEEPLWGTAEDEIHNNVLIGTSALVLLDYGDSDEYTHHPVSVFNNTMIVISGGAASFGFLARIEPNGLKFYNNILTSAASGDQAFMAINVNCNGLVDFNSYYRPSGGTSSWQTYSTHSIPSPPFFRDDASPLSAFGTALGPNTIGGGNAETNSTSGVNPLFVGSGANADFYKLQSGSPFKSDGSDAGRSDGTSTGSAVERGAWGGVVTRIGCNFA